MKAVRAARPNCEYPRNPNRGSAGCPSYPCGWPAPAAAPIGSRRQPGMLAGGSQVLGSEPGGAAQAHVKPSPQLQPPELGLLLQTVSGICRTGMIQACTLTAACVRAGTAAGLTNLSQLNNLVIKFAWDTST